MLTIGVFHRPEKNQRQISRNMCRRENIVSSNWDFSLVQFFGRGKSHINPWFLLSEEKKKCYLKSTIEKRLLKRAEVITTNNIYLFIFIFFFSTSINDLLIVRTILFIGKYFWKHVWICCGVYSKSTLLQFLNLFNFIQNYVQFKT